MSRSHGSKSQEPVPSGCFLGLATVDFLYRLPHLPVIGGKTVAEARWEFAGGPAANAAATFSLLGGKARLLAQIGNHSLASIIRKDLGRQVDIDDLAPRRSTPPSLSCIFITPGSSERTIVSSPAIPRAGRLPLDLSFDAVDVLLVDGHEMALSLEVAEQLRHEPGSRPQIVFDAGSWKERTDELLKLVDVVVASADFRPPGVETEHGVMDYFQDQGLAMAAMTRGERPILAFDRSSKNPGLQEIEVQPIEAGHELDTLAAGDVFHGAFCYFLARGDDVVTSLRHAGRVATASCRCMGPRDWAQDWEEASLL